MSRFEEFKDKASDVAEDAKHTVKAGVERAKAEVHEVRAEHELRQADRPDEAPDRRDRLKP